MPWEGNAERVDIFLISAIAAVGIYSLALLPLTPSLVGTHPVILELVRGSTSAIVTMGAESRIGQASLVVTVLAAIPGLMLFDWVYWWAGRRWGRAGLDFMLGNHPKAAKRVAQIERVFERYGWVALLVVYFQPIPNPLIYAAAGWTRMRLSTFLILDLIGSLAWIALLTALGYAIGQRAVDVAHSVSHYALWATIGLVVLVFAQQIWRQRRAGA